MGVGALWPCWVRSGLFLLELSMSLKVSAFRAKRFSVPWRLCHPPVGHCDTPTRTIRHCNDSPHKRFHIETIWPHRGRAVRPHPNRSIRPLRSGSKRWLWQSDPRTIRPIFCFARQVSGQFGWRHTDGAVKKQRCATREDFTHAWVSWAQAWPNLTPNMVRPTQQNST